MEKNVWLYFNTEADDDNVSDTSNIMFPAKNISGITPYLDGRIMLMFNSLRNTTSATKDWVHLHLKDNNTHIDVMKGVVRASNNQHPGFGGFLCVADDLTTVVGGSEDLSLPEYLLPQTGRIASCGSISIAQRTMQTVTATSDGLLTGAIPQGGTWTVTSSNADYIVTLPSAVKGRVVYLLCADAIGFELAAADPGVGGERINGITGSGTESAINTNVDFIIARCIKTDYWQVHQYTGVGDFDHVPIAD